MPSPPASTPSTPVAGRPTRSGCAAVRLRDGKRVVFGRPDAPDVPVGQAVAASCAVPGYFRPVSIDGRRYIDGSVRSLTNADLLGDAGLDLVLVISPMTQASARPVPAASGVARQPAPVPPAPRDRRPAPGRRTGRRHRTGPPCGPGHGSQPARRQAPGHCLAAHLRQRHPLAGGAPGGSPGGRRAPGGRAPAHHRPAQHRPAQHRPAHHHPACRRLAGRRLACRFGLIGPGLAPRRPARIASRLRQPGCYYLRRRNPLLDRTEGDAAWQQPELDLGRYKLGWSDVEDYYVFKPKKGLSEDIVREMSWMKGEPDWMTRPPAQGPAATSSAGPCRPGAATCPGSTSTTSTTTSSPSTSRSAPGTSCPSRSRPPTTSSASPRPSASTWPASPPSTSREVVYHRNREDLEAQGVLFCDMDTALREYPDLVKQYFGTVIPRQRQQVRRPQHRRVVGRQLHLRPARGQGRHAAAGLLPDQRREHGPVRAHPDHRRRGRPGALHRGLLGAGVHHRLPPLGRGRDHLQAVEPGHLHHHPELVQQRLQPGHQAGPLRRRGAHGVDRRQHRQPPDDEVPRRLPDGPQGLGRGPLGGLRRRRPAPGRRGQDGPRRPRDLLDDHLQVHLQGRRPHLLPGPGALRGGRPQVQELRALRRPAARRHSPAATPTRTSSSASRTPRSATRPRCPRSATTSSST